MNKIIISFILASIFSANTNASKYSKEIFAKTLAAEIQKNAEEMKKFELLRSTIQLCREIVPFFQEQFTDCIAYPEDTNCAKEQRNLDKFTHACYKAHAINKKHFQEWQNYLQNKTS